MTANRRCSQCLATCFVVGMTLWLTPPGAQASDRQPSLKPVTEALDQMGDDFCRTFKVRCPTKNKPSSKRVKKTKVKQTPRGPNTSSATTDSSVPGAPIPKLKPDRPKSKQAVDLEARSKPSLPLLQPKMEQDAAPKLSPVPVVTPKPKPAQQAKSQNRPVPGSEPEPARTQLTVAPPASQGSDESCMSRLKNAGVRFEAALASTDGPDCQIETPVRMFAVETAAGSIMLPEQPLLNCRFALQFSLWLSDAAAPGVTARTNAKLAKVATGPGHVCRGRNGDSTSKLSEHATGNAVDITTLTLEDGKIIQVSDAGDLSAASYQLLRGLRTTACGYFSTVLGPGSNAAHASHFHFDMGRHGKSASYKICE